MSAKTRTEPKSSSKKPIRTIVKTAAVFILCFAALAILIIFLETFAIGRTNLLGHFGIWPVGESAVFYTCRRCRAMKVKSYTREDLFAAITVHSDKTKCRHRWTRNISWAMEHPVKNGEIVLVRQAGTYGAFIPKFESAEDSSQEPTVSYTWYGGPDSEGNFRGDRLTSGSVEKARKIAFGSFRIDWSEDSEGTRWLHYEILPTDPVTTPDLQIALTGESNISKVNVYNKKWSYRAKRFQEP